MGSFQTVELIETFINYQESIKRCITIIYDPQRSALGGLAIKVNTATAAACQPCYLRPPGCKCCVA